MHSDDWESFHRVTVFLKEFSSAILIALDKTTWDISKSHRAEVPVEIDESLSLEPCPGLKAERTARLEALLRQASFEGFSGPFPWLLLVTDDRPIQDLVKRCCASRLPDLPGSTDPSRIIRSHLNRIDVSWLGEARGCQDRAVFSVFLLEAAIPMPAWTGMDAVPFYLYLLIGIENGGHFPPWVSLTPIRTFLKNAVAEFCAAGDCFNAQKQMRIDAIATDLKSRMAWYGDAPPYLFCLTPGSPLTCRIIYEGTDLPEIRVRGKKITASNTSGRSNLARVAMAAIAEKAWNEGGGYKKVAWALDDSSDARDSATFARWRERYGVDSFVDMARKEPGDFKSWLTKLKKR